MGSVESLQGPQLSSRPARSEALLLVPPDLSSCCACWDGQMSLLTPGKGSSGLLSPLTPMPWVLPVAILCLQTLLILRFTFCRLHHLLNRFIQLCLWIQVWDPTDRSGQGHCASPSPCSTLISPPLLPGPELFLLPSITELTPSTSSTPISSASLSDNSSQC